MPGLSRFDFYPRDWHLDTRDLSNAEKGVYIDLLASMYARGGPLPMVEQELCRLCGCATVRSLRPLLSKLFDKGKLKLIDGLVTNGRAMEEIAKFERQMAFITKGGKARSKRLQGEFEPNTTGTKTVTSTYFTENQAVIGWPPSPSPPPPSKDIPPTEGAAAPADPKKPIYDLGKSLLGKSSGGLVTRLIQHHNGDLNGTMRTLRSAAGASDPREYVGAMLRGDRQPETDWDAEYRRMGVS
jgi:uncharacterized protein YdaU (DUF1376 family)